MPTVDTSRLADLRAWLESCRNPCYDVRPIRVQIGRQTWEGCEYKQDCDGRHPGAPNQAPYTIHALYLLGALPPSYRRSSKECYPWQGTDWYIAGHTPMPDQDRRTQAQKEQYSPFGACFYLHPWKVPGGESIDQYEEKPYRRLPMTVEYLTSA